MIIIMIMSMWMIKKNDPDRKRMQRTEMPLQDVGELSQLCGYAETILEAQEKRIRLL